jgi:hypothetical protein
MGHQCDNDCGAFTGADGHAMGAGGTQCIAGVKKETPLWCEH